MATPILCCHDLYFVVLQYIQAATVCPAKFVLDTESRREAGVPPQEVPGSLMDDPDISESSENVVEDDSIWEELELSSSSLSRPKPAGRCGHVALSCGGGNVLVVIGGYNEEGILDDIWVLDIGAGEWSRVRTVGPTPPARAFLRGCAGPPPAGESAGSGDFAYLFGGSDARGACSNEVWCLNLEARSWSMLHAGGGEAETAAPSPRTNHALCNMENLLVLHAGESPSGRQLDDLWLFDPGEPSWTQARVSRTSPCPRARSSHCLGYAEEAGSLVVFGGLAEEGDDDPGDDERESMPLNDLWVLSPASAEALRGGGGEDAGGITEQDLPVWSLIMLDGVGPSPRSLAALGPRPAPHGDDGCKSGGTAELFLFGGYGLVELPASPEGDATGDLDPEDGDIIMAYIDDLWGLSLPGKSSDEGSVVHDLDPKSRGETNDTAVLRRTIGWVDEDGMGYSGTSPVEGRNGHSLVWCGEQLVLFGGFVGDGFVADVHVAETPPLAPLL